MRLIWLGAHGLGHAKSTNVSACVKLDMPNWWMSRCFWAWHPKLKTVSVCLGVGGASALMVPICPSHIYVYTHVLHIVLLLAEFGFNNTLIIHEGSRSGGLRDKVSLLTYWPWTCRRCMPNSDVSGCLFSYRYAPIPFNVI